MQLTEYAVLNDNDLIDMVLMDANATTRELELANRLLLAHQMLEEHGANPRGESQVCLQESTDRA